MDRHGLPQVAIACALFFVLGMFSCGKGGGVNVPAGWKRSGPGIYEIRSTEKKASETVRILNDGLEPWRSEAINQAAACLIEFGIVTDMNAVSLAERLTTIEENSLYSCKKGNEQYEIGVKFFDDIPVAVRLKVSCVPE